jgi:hypothetical protein
MMSEGNVHYPHRIRLRGPWQCSREGDESGSWRVTMPCRFKDAGLSGFRGTARFLRKFGYPGRIDTFEHVWLIFEGCIGCVEVHLNGQKLGQIGSYDVTSLLTERNHLEVWIQGDSDEAGLWGEVALEIRRDAWLTDLQTARTETSLFVTGKVTGLSTQPLELYTLVGGRHADYRTIQPCPEGQPFRIQLLDVVAAGQTVRVELVHISSIWYVAEVHAE